MFFALLLVNIFIAKDLHYIIEFNHDHDHSHSLVDRHSNCAGDTHFHGYTYQSDCSICDFNFSPKDQTTLERPYLEQPIFSSLIVSSLKNLCFKFTGSPPTLRGPPSLFS